MKPTFLVFLLFLGTFLIGFLLRRPILSSIPSQAEIEGYIDRLIKSNSPPGLSVVVVKNGEIVYEEAFGMADGPLQIPTTNDTAYHWWSMTKVPTALAVLQLSELGKLDLDATVSDYLPFFNVMLDGATTPVTVRQLLRHTSGLPDPTPAMIGWVHYEDETYNQVEQVEKYLPEYNQLKFAPDTQASYSNLGYMVLGAVIEAVSGYTYESYVRTQILQPLEMQETAFLYTDLETRAATGSHPFFSIYTPLLPSLLDMNALVRERNVSVYWLNPVYLDVTPSSGLIGTARDAGILANALLAQHAFLDPDSHALLLPVGSSVTGRPLGWHDFSGGQETWVQHRGGGPGFATIMRLYPEEHLGIVIMANSTNLPAEKLVEAFAGLEW